MEITREMIEDWCPFQNVESDQLIDARFFRCRMGCFVSAEVNIAVDVDGLIFLKFFYLRLIDPHLAVFNGRFEFIERFFVFVFTDTSITAIIPKVHSANEIITLPGRMTATPACNGHRNTRR